MLEFDADEEREALVPLRARVSMVLPTSIVGDRDGEDGDGSVLLGNDSGAGE